MKWFKHRTDAADGEFLSELIVVFGLEGYARWWILLEKIGGRMDKSDCCSAAYPWEKWQIFLKGKRKKLEEFLNFCEAKGKINLKHFQNISETNPEQTGNQPETNLLPFGNILEIECPNLLKIRDNYTKNLQVTDKKLASKDTDKRNKIKKKKEKTFLPDSAEIGLACLFASLLEKRGHKWPKNKKPDTQKWAAEIDRLIRIDGNDPKEIESAIRWAVGDCHEPKPGSTWKGWGYVILSPANLREKWQQLTAQMNKPGKPQSYGKVACRCGAAFELRYQGQECPSCGKPYHSNRKDKPIGPMPPIITKLADKMSA